MSCINLNITTFRIQLFCRFLCQFMKRMKSEKQTNENSKSSPNTSI